MQEAFGVAADHPDLKTLRLIDQLPSLDPFLLREQLRRGGVDAAPCYFALSDSRPGAHAGLRRRRDRTAGRPSASAPDTVGVSRLDRAHGVQDPAPTTPGDRLERPAPDAAAGAGAVSGGRLLLEGLPLLQMGADQPCWPRSPASPTSRAHDQARRPDRPRPPRNIERGRDVLRGRIMQDLRRGQPTPCGSMTTPTPS